MGPGVGRGGPPSSWAPTGVGWGSQNPRASLRGRLVAPSSAARRHLPSAPRPPLPSHWGDPAHAALRGLLGQQTSPPSAPPPRRSEGSRARLKGAPCRGRTQPRCKLSASVPSCLFSLLPRPSQSGGTAGPPPWAAETPPSSATSLLLQVAGGSPSPPPKSPGLRSPLQVSRLVNVTPHKNARRGPTG